MTIGYSGCPLAFSTGWGLKIDDGFSDLKKSPMRKPGTPPQEEGLSAGRRKYPLGGTDLLLGGNKP